MTNLFSELTERGLVKQITNEQKIKDLLDHNSISFYSGFDPTADGLHVGHLLPIILSKRLFQHGHCPIMLIGGATALIGDPTGKTDMRKMLSKEDINHNIDCVSKQIKSIIKDVQVANNNDWFNPILFLEFMRDIGSHFSINTMLRADCFKSRLENGLSFLELSYMLMQGFDFLHLNTNNNTVLQIGGDDQWSNILGGIDLIRKKNQREVFGMTIPLLIKSDGVKMGKTESGAVWLDPKKTSPLDFFQFWRNIDDADLHSTFLKMSFRSVEEINQIMKNENINETKKKMAFDITEIVHGTEIANQVLDQSTSLFEQKDFSNEEVTMIDDNQRLIAIMSTFGLSKSNTDARNLILGRGVFVNDTLITDVNFVINREDFPNNIIIKKGKKTHKVFSIKS